MKSLAILILFVPLLVAIPDEENVFLRPELFGDDYVNATEEVKIVVNSKVSEHNTEKNRQTTTVTIPSKTVTSTTVTASSAHAHHDHGHAFTKKGDLVDAIFLFEKFLAEEKTELLSSSQEEKSKLNLHWYLNKKQRAMNKCSMDVNSMIAAAKKRIHWALELIDATGKPDSDILQESPRFIGDFDKCLETETGLDFQGRYCSTNVWISRVENITLPSLTGFYLGVCFPSSCDSSDVEEFINTYFQSHSDKVVAGAVHTYCQDRHIELTVKAKLIITVLSLFTTLLVVATGYDVVYKRWWLETTKNDNNANESGVHGSTEKSGFSEHKPIFDPEMQKPKLYSDNKAVSEEKTGKSEVVDQILMSFSVYTNTVKLLSTRQPAGSITCIHGIRFLSMTWLILLHALILGRYPKEHIHPFLEKQYGRWTFMIAFKSTQAVDTFFAMAGLLMTYVILKDLKKKAVTVGFFANFYIHRYLRLTSPYMLILMTYVPLFKYMSDGPFWSQKGFEVNECEDSWWINPLYLNNFVKDERSCMPWTWYLACDMQFYILSPLLFLPMFFYQWKGMFVPFLFLLGNAVISGVISKANDLRGAMDLDYLDEGILSPYYTLYYFKPYTRIGPFIVGMMTGFILFKSECKARLPKWAVCLGWMSATGVALSVVYGLYDHVSPNNLLSYDVYALYNALHRIAWGMSVCWVIFACANGYGGFVNTILSWNALVPLSKLGYCTYLIHPIVTYFYFFSQRKTFYVNNLNEVFAFLGITVISYGVAYLASMAYEVPMLGLERVVRGQLKKNSKTELK